MAAVALHDEGGQAAEGFARRRQLQTAAEFELAEATELMIAVVEIRDGCRVDLDAALRQHGGSRNEDRCRSQKPAYEQTGPGEKHHDAPRPSSQCFAGS